MSEITCESGIAIDAGLKQGSNSFRIRMGIVVGFERKLSVVNSSLSARFNFLNFQFAFTLVPPSRLSSQEREHVVQ